MFKRSAVVACIMFFLFGVYHYMSKPKDDLPVIAITQIIEHIPLDTVREGILKRLKEKGYVDGKNVRIVYQNAHGQIPTAAQIAKYFETLNAKVLVALSTQSAQLLQPLYDQQKSILVFSAVTDPVSARLVENMESPPVGVFGVCDYMDPAPQVAMLRTFIPTLKTLGVLYNPSEMNSVVYLKDFEKACSSLGIHVVRSPLNNTSEAVASTHKLLGHKVQAIYFPNDNTAMASVSAIVNAAHYSQNPVPVFSNDKASVEKGCVAALAYDRTMMGYDTADLIVHGLENGRTAILPIKKGTTIQTIVNDGAFTIFPYLHKPKEPVVHITPVKM